MPIKHWDLPTSSSVLEFDMTSFPRARGHPMTEDEFTLRFIPIFRQLVTTATTLLTPFRHIGTSHWLTRSLALTACWHLNNRSNNKPNRLPRGIMRDVSQPSVAMLAVRFLGDSGCGGRTPSFQLPCSSN